MAKFKFDKLMSVLDYYDIQKDFLTRGEDGLESFNFDNLFEIGLDENDFPDNFAQFKKLNIDLDKIVVHCQDIDENEVSYLFEPNINSIAIFSDTWTMKEAITIINLVMQQQLLDKKLCYEVIIGHTSDEEHFTHYAQETTAFGMWWNDFIKLYQEKIDDIDFIELNLDDNEITIILYKKENEEE